jgi:hypothetical protein
MQPWENIKCVTNMKKEIVHFPFRHKSKQQTKRHFNTNLQNPFLTLFIKQNTIPYVEPSVHGLVTATKTLVRFPLNSVQKFHILSC